MAAHVHRNDDPIECPYKDALGQVLSPDHVVVRRDDLRNILDNADLHWCKQDAEDRLLTALEAE